MGHAADADEACRAACWRLVEKRLIAFFALRLVAIPLHEMFFAMWALRLVSLCEAPAACPLGPWARLKRRGPKGALAGRLAGCSSWSLRSTTERLGPGLECSGVDCIPPEDVSGRWLDVRICEPCRSSEDFLNCNRMNLPFTALFSALAQHGAVRPANALSMRAAPRGSMTE